jgi:hypothetical protein
MLFYQVGNVVRSIRVVLCPASPPHREILRKIIVFKWVKLRVSIPLETTLRSSLRLFSSSSVLTLFSEGFAWRDKIHTVFLSLRLLATSELILAPL